MVAAGTGRGAVAAGGAEVLTVAEALEAVEEDAALPAVSADVWLVEMPDCGKRAGGSSGRR